MDSKKCHFFLDRQCCGIAFDLENALEVYPAVSVAQRARIECITPKYFPEQVTDNLPDWNSVEFE
jgi:hypothetical protein